MPIFMEIEGIKGESNAAGHKGEIDVLSFSWGEGRAGLTGPGGGGGGSGKATFNDFHFTHRADKASPKLFEVCSKGNHIPQATLTVRKDGRNPSSDYYKYKFEDILISSLQSSAEGNRVPTEQVSLNFEKITISYAFVRPNGQLGPETEVTIEGDREPPRAAGSPE